METRTGAWTIPSSLVDGVDASGVDQFEMARYRSGRLEFSDRESVVQVWSVLQFIYAGS